MNQEDSKRLFDAIVSAAVNLWKSDEVLSEKDVTILFPKDHLAYGLGSEIIIDVLLKRHSGYKVGKTLGGVLKGFFPDARIEVHLAEASHEIHDFWSSDMKGEWR